MAGEQQGTFTAGKQRTAGEESLYTLHLYEDEPRVFLVSFRNSILALENIDENHSCWACKTANQILATVGKRIEGKNRVSFFPASLNPQ